MGMMVQPICKCDSEFKGLNLGGGFSDFGSYCGVPTPCLHCRDVFEINIFNKRHRCPKCRKKVTPYGKITPLPSSEPKLFEWGINFEDSSTYELDDKKYQCPICNEEELTFELIGVWD